MAARLLALAPLVLVAFAAAASAQQPSLGLPDIEGLVPVQGLPAAPGLPDPSGPGLGGPGGHAAPPPTAPDLVGPDGSWDAGFLALGIAGGVGAAGALVWGGTRFREPDVLDHEVRCAIYRYVQEHVGASLKEITESLQLSTTNAVWHLRKLEEGGLVRGRKFNGAKVYYPTAGGVQARNLSIAGAALASDNARDILRFVLEHPGVHQREVGRLLNVNHGTVRWHLKKLRKAELLEERRTGGTATYHTTDLGEEALRVVAARAQAQPAPVVQAVPAEPGRA
jgi:DNA-binding transcriptional ArsR family regulator